jgi:hypothetical protein
MPVTPTDSTGTKAIAGYSPGNGVYPLQLGVPTADGTGANAQKSAPAIVQATLTGTTTGSASATVWAAGELRVQEQPTQQFFTAYDTGLDTTNAWKAPTASGGGVAATSATANTVLGTGTTASGYSYLESQATFPPEAPGWLLIQHAINIEFPVSVNAYRFWGLGTSPGSPTAAAPLTNAIGFEVATTGKMYAVVYASGTRMVVQDLSTGTGNSTQPQDANVYSFNMYFRGDKTYFSIGSLDNIVAQTYGGPGPDVNTLPVKLTAIAGSTPPVSSVLLTSNAATVAATSRNNVQLSDGTYQWRKASVDTAGNLAIRGGYTELASLTAGSLNADLVPSTDVSAYKWWSLHINANAYSGTITFQGSNDNSGWISIEAESVSAVTTMATTVAAASVMYVGQAMFRYLRIRMTAYASGAAQGTLELYTTSPAPHVSGAVASQSGTWTVQPGNTANTTAWLFAHGGTNTVAIAAGAAANTVVKASAGRIARILVTTTGTNPLQVFDNASTNSGTIIAALPASPAIGTYSFDLPAAAGITIAGNASNPGITVSYY